MNTAERIRTAMDNNGITQAELSRKTGIPKSTLNEWLKGKYEPKQDNAFLLAKALGVSPSWLMGIMEEEDEFDFLDTYNQLNSTNQTKVYTYASDLLEEQNQVKEDNIIYITSKLSAGTGIVDLDPEHKEPTEYDGKIPKHDLAFIVSGDSMEPTFKDGEVVFVKKTTEVRNGQFIAVQINEEAYVKKAYLEEDKLRLVSLNKKYDDIIANENDDIRVVGIVIL